MRGRWLAVSGTTASSALLACLLFPDVADLSSPDATADASGDASAEASGPEHNACGALLFGTPVPLEEPGFETSTNCAPWEAYQSSLTTDDTAPAEGNYACRVCTNGAGGGGQILETVANLDAQAGDVYALVACVRGFLDAGSVAQIKASIGIQGGSAGFGSDVIPTDSYQAISAQWTTTQSGALYVKFFRPYGSDAGDCFLVDDVSLRKLDDGG